MRPKRAGAYGNTQDTASIAVQYLVLKASLASLEVAAWITKCSGCLDPELDRREPRRSQTERKTTTMLVGNKYATGTKRIMHIVVTLNTSN